MLFKSLLFITAISSSAAPAADLLSRLQGHWQGHGIRQDLQLSTNQQVLEDSTSLLQSLQIGGLSKQVLVSKNQLRFAGQDPADATEIDYWMAPASTSDQYDIGNLQSWDVQNHGNIEVGGSFVTTAEQQLNELHLQLKTSLQFIDDTHTHYTETMYENGQVRTIMSIDFTKNTD